MIFASVTTLYPLTFSASFLLISPETRFKKRSCVSSPCPAEELTVTVDEEDLVLPCVG
jgi:hypothetical protein